MRKQTSCGAAACELLSAGWDSSGDSVGCFDVEAVGFGGTRPCASASMASNGCRVVCSVIEAG